jgi:hypothetical protein
VMNVVRDAETWRVAAKACRRADYELIVQV